MAAALSVARTDKGDRSAAYAARYVAKNIVAAGLAEKCTIQVSYAIGISHPLSVYVTPTAQALSKTFVLMRLFLL